MTPAGHATEAAESLVLAATPTSEREIDTLRAQAHAILSKAAGTGTNYAAAEQLLTDADNPSAARIYILWRAIAHAHLAE